MNLPPELASLNIQPPWNVDYSFQRMVLTEDGECYPLLSLTGYRLYNSYRRHILAIGNRKATKSVCIADKCARHMWEVDGAIVAVVCRTTRNAKIGVWRDVKNFVLPGWENAGFGFKILKCGTDPASKMEYIQVRNRHGGVSEIQLHSLDYAFDAEAKFKGGRFSMVWLSEADQFEDRVVFDILTDQLRVIGVPYEQHQIIADCNWPEEGEDHWLFSIFESAKDPNSKYYRDDYDREFEIIKFSLFSNPFLDQREKDDLKRKYAHDPIKYQRYVDGDKWVKDATSGLFSETFHFNIHVKGNADGADKSKWQIITPHKNARALLVGIDTGSLSNAAGFWVPRMNEKGEFCYDAFDEVVSIEKPIPIRAFAKSVWERVQFWNEWMVKTYGLKQAPRWRYWADSSLWNFNSGANNNDAAIFWDVSQGNMGLRPTIKGRDSIKQRIELMNRLFFDDRVAISAHCRWTIAWARFLKAGRAKNEPISKATMQFKHKFDADTYCIGMELPHELNNDDAPSVATGVITT